jgi:hypothetical protein
MDHFESFILTDLISISIAFGSLSRISNQTNIQIEKQVGFDLKNLIFYKFRPNPIRNVKNIVNDQIGSFLK